LYFKITNSKENHYGFQYHDGLNILKDEFNDDPEASCVPGGFYFTDAEHILEFLDYGIYLREITLPIDDPDFKIVKDGNKWRANKIILEKRRNLSDASTFEYLMDQGTDIHDNDDAINWALIKGHLDIVQLLIKNGTDINALNNRAVKIASRYGQWKIVKVLIDSGADIHIDNDCALRYASEYGHLGVVQFLISKDANIHAENDYALRLASENGHLGVVQFLISKGADIHAGNDYAIGWASSNQHLNIAKILISHGADISIYNRYVINSVSTLLELGNNLYE